MFKKKDLTFINQKVGTLTVISDPIRSETDQLYVVSCRCDCGHVDRYIEKYFAQIDSPIRCKMCFIRNGADVKKKGYVCEYLTCITDIYCTNHAVKGKRRVIDVQCKCGRIQTLAPCNIGKRKFSCGHCEYSSRLRREHRIGHGDSHTRLYHIWQGMKYRCFNANSPEYKYYGGKGVTICKEWMDFKIFRNWATSNGYTDKLTIERKDPTLGYYHNNCVWISREENSRHRNAYYPKRIKELESEVVDLKRQLKEYQCKDYVTTLQTYEIK